MTKKIEFDVVCPDCGWVQKYHSHRKDAEIDGKRRAECRRCGRSFKAYEQRKEKVKDHERKDPDEKKTGFHKYSSSKE